MSISHAMINVKDLRLRTYIGFNAEERTKLQDVVINMEIHYPAQSAGLSDEVSQALDYKQITKKVIAHVEEGHFLLLEKLVADVLAICHQDPRVSFAKVSIDKPHALRFADSVSLTMQYRQDAP